MHGNKKIGYNRSLGACAGLSLLALTTAFMCSGSIAEPTATKAAKVKVAKAAPAKKPAEPATPAAPDKEKLVYNGKPVMDPSQFFGAAAMGYASAKAAPEVMQYLFCYCGCDVSDSHSYLIDCYTSPHGMDCHICQEEAVLALRMYRDGAKMSEIQQRVDNEYSKNYPFQTESDNYKKYKASRLYKPEGAAAAPAQTAGPEPAPAASDKDKGGKPKVKPGMKVGNCCGEHDKKKK